MVLLGISWNASRKLFRGNIELEKNTLILMELESGTVVLSLARFVLTLTDPKNTLFGMSDVVECPVRKMRLLR